MSARSSRWLIRNPSRLNRLRSITATSFGSFVTTIAAPITSITIAKAKFPIWNSTENWRTFPRSGFQTMRKKSSKPMMNPSKSSRMTSSISSVLPLILFMLRLKNSTRLSLIPASDGIPISSRSLRIRTLSSTITGSGIPTFSVPAMRKPTSTRNTALPGTIYLILSPLLLPLLVNRKNRFSGMSSASHPTQPILSSTFSRRAEPVMSSRQSPSSAASLVSPEVKARLRSTLLFSLPLRSSAV